VKKELKRAIAFFHPDHSRHLPTLRERVEAEEVFSILHKAYEHVCETLKR
jgi:preprotein translocase subunit Sec63